MASFHQPVGGQTCGWMYSPVASPQDPSPACLELISASRHQRACFEYFPTPANIFFISTARPGGCQYLKNCGILILCFLKVNSQVNEFTISLLLGPLNEHNRISEYNWDQVTCLSPPQTRAISRFPPAAGRVLLGLRSQKWRGQTQKRGQRWTCSFK